jgi:hypothetical protein
MPDDPDGLIKLDVLLEQKRKQKSDLEVAIAGGTAAQGKLAFLSGVLADLDALEKRRQRLIADADKRFADAKTKASDVNTAVAPITTMLGSLPGKPKLELTALDAIVTQTLTVCPDPTKTKYGAYVTAFNEARAKLDESAAAAVQARDAAEVARIAIDRAESALQAMVDRDVATAKEAEAALSDGLRARSSADYARAYWAKSRITALVAVVAPSDAVIASAKLKAFQNAKLAVTTAIDVYADAVSARLVAEAALAEDQAKRAKAADQLGEVTDDVLKKLLDAVAKAKATAGP